MIFGSFCASMFFFVYFFIPETKGSSTPIQPGNIRRIIVTNTNIKQVSPSSIWTSYSVVFLLRLVTISSPAEIMTRQMLQEWRFPHTVVIAMLRG